MRASLAVLAIAKQVSLLSPVSFGLIVDLVARLSGQVSDVPDCRPLFTAICHRTAAIGVSCDGRIVAVNAYFANLLGYEAHELVGASISIVVAGPRVTTPTAQPFRTIVPHRHKAGHIIPFECLAVPIHVCPGSVYWIGIFTPQ